MRHTKQQASNQLRIKDILRQKRLSDEDKEFVLDNYIPDLAVKTGAFFTPRPIAHEVAVWSEASNDTVLDLCAGIGSLAYAVKDLWPRPKKIVAVEQSEELVAIGKKLVPEATWVCGSIFDQALMKKLGKFGVVISNPPYGLRKIEADWLKYNGSSDLMAVEVGLRSAGYGVFILPRPSVPWQYSYRDSYQQQSSPTLTKFKAANPDLELGCLSVDMSIYKDDWVDGISKVELVGINRMKPTGR